MKAKDADLVDGSLVIERLHFAIDALHCEQAQLGKQVAPLGTRDKESKSSRLKKSAGELINDRNSRSAEPGCLAKWNDKDPAKARTYEEYSVSSAARRQIRPTELEARRNLRDEELKGFCGQAALHDGGGRAAHGL